MPESQIMRYRLGGTTVRASPPLAQPPQNLRGLPAQAQARDVDVEDRRAFVLALAFHQLGAAMAAEARVERRRAGSPGARAVARQLDDVRRLRYGFINHRDPRAAGAVRSFGSRTCLTFRA